MPSTAPVAYLRQPFSAVLVSQPPPTGPPLPTSSPTSPPPTPPPPPRGDSILLAASKGSPTTATAFSLGTLVSFVLVRGSSRRGLWQRWEGAPGRFKRTSWARSAAPRVRPIAPCAEHELPVAVLPPPPPRLADSCRAWPPPLPSMR